MNERRPLLVDLFCKAGGAAMGYHRAGFDVLGIDIEPQPNYPFRFEQADAMEWLRWEFTLPIAQRAAAYHASPPCQRHSSMTRGRWKDRVEGHPDLIAPTRDYLVALGKPFIIENVVGAPLLNPITLCGSMFGLQSDFGNQLRRHRLFETSFAFTHTLRCAHSDASPIGVYGGGQHPSRRRRRYNPATEGIDFGVEQRKRAMGIGWMTGRELNQAIPPAYTEYLGQQLLAHLETRKVA